MRKSKYVVPGIIWIIGLYFYVFEFDDMSDNRLFLPGLIGMILIPIGVYLEWRKGR